MKNIINKFSELTLKKKIQLITAIILTICLITAIPIYAWFINQKKAAEMFKVKFPNSLYINAAHREDQCNLKLDGININGYQKDPLTGITLLDENDQKIRVTSYQYVFSVSGSSTNEFILQMAHTTNNLFTYRLYEAENYSSCTENTNEITGDIDSYTLTGTNIGGNSKTATVSAENKNLIVKYTHKADTHNENKLQVTGDNYVNDSESDLYYLRNSTVITGEGIGYKNQSVNEQLAIKSTDNSYYTKTYGNNLKVEEHAVPLYWQGSFTVTSDSSKNFCKYFILEVTWDEDQQAAQTEKETDIIYLSVKRVS